MRRARSLLPALLAACGDPAAPDADDAGDVSTAPATSTDAPATSTGEALTTTEGDGDGSGDTGAAGCPPGPAPVVERGFFPAGAAPTDVVLAACSEDRWYFAAPGESTLELVLTRTDGAAASATIAYPDEPAAQVWSAGALVAPVRSDAAPASAVFPVPRSGEFALHVRTDMSEAPAGYDLELRCLLGCARETTRFPIVLVHGWTGFQSIGPLEYFFDVPDELTGLGYPVEVARLDPYNHTRVRSGQLAGVIDAALPKWRARKVDLIGHSQGGVDSRAVVATHGYGDRVSAVITVASPHRGSYIADLALGLAPGPVEDVAGLLLNFLGAVTAQQKSDAIASFESLSEQHMIEEFNPANPDDPRVRYISYTGRTCDALDFLDADQDCQDLVDPLIGWSYALLKGPRGANDGLVPVDSAVWGEYRGEMVADHIDEVGQIAGITDPKFDHLAFYRDRARELAAGQH